ncbi:hypothetical protein I7X12_17830 [Halosimplex litoreum]|uniref:Uncharacterized protein n=1 Tax=Halosimplex litoreum TaxID=1198301 RepID=A0A7T3FXJ9_9EURY|nr:hypothetical protein [Halosimplex litoreum]QPV62568.1 hypothetical protein I7X12_17830 [Halosimplex litoreum]
MRVRDWQDILEDVVESDADPGGWRAAGGDRASGIGEDLYFGHPSVGVFQVKTYARNPYEVQGVGAEVARKIDDDLDPLFPEEPGDGGMFGVQQPMEDEAAAEDAATELEEVVQAHADAPTTPDALFEDVMDTLDSPAYGPMEYDQYGRPDRVEDLADTFEEAEQLLDSELDDLIDENVDRGFQ